MSYSPDNALIIQSDRTVLLDVHAPKAEAAQSGDRALCRTDQKSRTHPHLSPQSAEHLECPRRRDACRCMVAALQDNAKYPMPESVAQELEALGERYGLTTLNAEKADQEMPNRFLAIFRACCYRWPINPWQNCCSAMSR